MNPNADRERPIQALAAMERGGRLQPHAFDPRALGPMDVELRVTHCGICHTDLHLINNDFGLSSYPLVPGHEIVGVVSDVGDQVTQLRAGQRMGVGWLAGACFVCEQCAAGRDNLCPSGQPTCLGREGGFASRIRVDSRFAFPIPDGLASEAAAPLLCAGITVFAPLLRHSVSGNSRLGVIGIGGLGHLALQFGRSLGCRVIAFSSSPAKEQEARQFGADTFVASNDAGSLQRMAGSCDFLLCTVTADLPWADYLNVLRPGGKLCIVGVPEHDLRLPVLPLILGQKSVVSSVIGSRWEIQTMLDLSARHRIAPQIELFPMREVNPALDRLRANRMRYRAVLVNEP